MRVKAKSRVPPPDPPPEALGVGGRLKLAIKALGKWQKDIAEEYGCSPSYVTEMVRERNRLPVDFTAWLQVHYNVNLNWLFTGKGPMFLAATEAMSIAEDAAHYEALSDERLLIEVGRRIGERNRLLARMRELSEGRPQDGEDDPPSDAADCGA